MRVAVWGEASDKTYTEEDQEPHHHAEVAAAVLHTERTVAATPLRPTKRKQSPIAYGDTIPKLAELRQLFAEKQRGERNNLSWSAACRKVEIDPKTAKEHLTDIKAAWQALDYAPKHASQDRET